MAGLESGHLPSNGFNQAGQFYVENVTPGLVPSQDQASHEFLPAMDGQGEATHDLVTDGDRSGMDFDRNFPISRCRFLHFLRMQHLLWAGVVVDNNINFDNALFK